MDINNAKQNAIDQQIRPWGGLNDVANDALKNTPREIFVPEKYQNLAFADIEIPLTDKAKMLFPKIEGRLLACLDIQKNESILEIGTGSGYLTAVLAKLGKKVTSIEIDPVLHNSAKSKLNDLKIDNVQLQIADISRGWQCDDFFDVVVVSASVVKVSKYYLHLLNIGGRIFVVEGVKDDMSAKLITRINEDKWTTKSLFETHLEPMLGLPVVDNFEF